MIRGCLIILVTTVIFGCSNNKIFDNATTGIPLVINTWAFTKATEQAWITLVDENKSAIDAIEAGCIQCENAQCDHTVGYGGSPDENGETTLDALIFDGNTMNMGAVAGLRRVKHASSVARKVLENTEHSILVGDLATNFAKQMGFTEESLTTNFSSEIHQKWKSKDCQPNFWKNVVPDPREHCGPYKALPNHFIDEADSRPSKNQFGEWNHDTLSMIVIDDNGSIVAGTSSNGATNKIPGRIGDAPLPGAGAYADSLVGAAVATGDGDVMMRFLPSSTIVEMMRNGVSPQMAVQKLIRRIARFYPKFQGAIIAVNRKGEYAAGCHGIDFFPYSLRSKEIPSGVLLQVPCI